MTDATCAACLTPPGRGAIAVLAVRGPQAWEVVRPLFRPYRDSSACLPENPVLGRVWLGWLGADAADEVVLSVTRLAPVTWLEVHCHGGPEVVRMLLDAFAARGAAVLPWTEFNMRTAPNPGPARAVAELVQACTVRTAGILLDQVHGAFDRALAEISAGLAGEEPQTAAAQLAQLVSFAPVGRHLTAPWRVAVIGPPNVGKSSLVNALAGFQRSVVSATPGTTRDVVTTLIAVDGWPLELADTAGMRIEPDSLEAQGIARARAAAALADARLWVMDASVPPIPDNDNTMSALLVVNKMDLPTVWDLSAVPQAVHVSAKTGAGLGGLCERLAAWLVPAPPPPGAAVPYTAELCDTIEAAHRVCQVHDWSEARRILEPLCSVSVHGAFLEG